MKLYDEHDPKGACSLHWKKQPWEWPGNEGTAHFPFLWSPDSTHQEEQTHKWVPVNSNSLRILNCCWNHTGTVLPSDFQILHYPPKTTLRHNGKYLEGVKKLVDFFGKLEYENVERQRSDPALTGMCFQGLGWEPKWKGAPCGEEHVLPEVSPLNSKVSCKYVPCSWLRWNQCSLGLISFIPVSITLM